MKEEIWKEIEGYNGDYLISNHGRVKSFKRNKNGIIMKPSVNKTNYLYLELKYNTKRKKFYIHRLVAESFIKNSNPDKYNQVNHIDENKQNNYFENLEWCNAQYNAQYNAEYSLSKQYKILFPDDHIEMIFNLKKFCRKFLLDDGAMFKTLIGNYHKGYKILKIIDKKENTIKSNNTYRKMYKISFLENKIFDVKDLNKFCIQKKLNYKHLLYTFNHGNSHNGYKILSINNEILITYNLNKFCRENNLNKNCLHRTYQNGKVHKGYKIIEKINKDGKLIKPKSK
jgi:hypothetical protein